MKWKTNIVLLVAYVIGSAYESQSSITPNAAIDCDLICSATNGNKNTTAEKNYCKCSTIQNDGSRNKIRGNNENSFKNNMTAVTNNKKTLAKRDTISEIIARRQKNRNQSPKSITFLPAENSLSKWQLNRNAKVPEKQQIKFKNSGLLYNNKPNARIKEIEERMKELRSKMSMKPSFQSRNAFPESDTTQNLIKQLKGKREELLNDLKTFQSKGLSGKYAFKERVGAVNPMQNHLDDMTSRFKSKLKPKSETEDKKHSKEEVKINDDTDNDKEETVSKHKPSASTETAPSTAQIPVIVLRQSNSSSPKSKIVDQTEIVDQKESPKLDIAPVVETTTKKVESVSLTLEKLKEKRQETVMKIKDKLSAAKSNLKHIETNEES